MIAQRRTFAAGLAFATAMLAAGFASALDLAPLEKWSRTMGVCARIVAAATAERPPPDHGAYMLRLKAAEAAGNSASKPREEPLHDAYAAFIDQKTQELADCGRLYRLQLQQAWPIVQELQGLDEAQVPKADPRYVAAARVRDASMALGKAIESLSENKLAESMLMQPLLDYFLRKSD